MAGSGSLSAVLITGLPGVGKTTAIKKLVTDLSSKGVQTNGFYTEEVRDNNNSRIGFDAITFDGKRDKLARTRDSSESNVRRPMVGKYSVYVNEFEKISLPVFGQPTSVLIIDEIGKMELLSKNFEQQIKLLIPQIRSGKVKIIATIPCRHASKLVEEIKSLPNAKLFEITKENRCRCYEDIKKFSFDILHVVK